MNPVRIELNLLIPREFLVDNILVRIHLIIEMSLVDRPCAMTELPLFR